MVSTTKLVATAMLATATSVTGQVTFTTLTLPVPLAAGASQPGMAPYFGTFSWTSDGQVIVATASDFGYPPVPTGLTAPYTYTTAVLGTGNHSPSPAVVSVAAVASSESTAAASSFTFISPVASSTASGPVSVSVDTCTEGAAGASSTNASPAVYSSVATTSSNGAPSHPTTLVTSVLSTAAGASSSSAPESLAPISYSPQSSGSGKATSSSPVVTVYTTVYAGGPSFSASTSAISSSQDTSTSSSSGGISISTSSINTTSAPSSSAGAASDSSSSEQPTSSSTSSNSSSTSAQSTTSEVSSASLSSAPGSTVTPTSMSGSAAGPTTRTSLFTFTSEVLPTTSVNTAQASAAAASSSASSCPEIGVGLIGDFTLTFDDLADFTTDDNEPAPIYNPYNALYFGNGYGYTTPTFTPPSPPNVAIFQPNESTTDIGSPEAAGGPPGEISCGPDASNSALWFNTHQVFIACISPEDVWCTVSYNAYVWDEGSSNTRLAYMGESDMPSCPTGSCGLFPMDRAVAQNALTSITIQATVNGQPVPFYMDNFAMSWYDNSCEAAETRSRVH